MAISLGDINFSLGADTQQLQQSQARLRAFGKEVDRVSRSQADGAEKVASAYRRQEAAVTGALQKTLNLNAAIRRAGGDSSLIDRVNNSYNLYANQLTSTAVKSLTLQRANERLAASMNQVKRELDDLKRKQQDQGWSKFISNLQNTASAAALVSGPLGGIAARLTSLSTLFNRAGGSAAIFYAGIAVGAGSLAKLGMAVLENSRKINAAESAFQSISGSVTATNRLLQESRTIANASGQAFATVATQYARFNAAAQGTNLAGREAASIFDTVAKVTGQLQLPVEQAEGVFRALEQMMSKGTIQAEELRGQLGDRLPGAFQIMARALGVSTSKLGEMLKQGQVLADDALPKFAEELRRTFNIDGDVNNFQASINRAANSWSYLLDEIDKTFSITQIAMGALDAISTVLDTLSDRFFDLRQILSVAGYGFQVLGAELRKWANVVGGIVSSVLAGFKGMFGQVGNLIDAFKKDLAEFAANPLSGGGGGNLRAALADGFTGAFTKAYAKTMEETRKFNEQIDAETAAAGKKLGQNLILDRMNRSNGDLLGLGTPSGSTDGSGLSEKEMKKRAKALAEANLEIDRMRQSVVALGTGGSVALEQLNIEFEKQDKIRDFAKNLEMAGVSAQLAQQRIADYTALVDQFYALTAASEAQAAAMKELQDVGSRSFDRLGSALATFTSSAKLNFDSFREVLKNVADDLLQTMFMLTAINPIKNSLFGLTGSAAAPTLGALNLFGSGGGSVSSVSSGLGTLYANGGIMNKPTLFSTSTAAGYAIGGEAGEEAVLPLRRTSSGQLGVISAGGGGGGGTNNTTYNIDARGADVEAIQRLEQALTRLDRSIEPRALSATKDARVRNSRMAR